MSEKLAWGTPEADKIIDNITIRYVKTGIYSVWAAIVRYDISANIGTDAFPRSDLSYLDQLGQALRAELPLLPHRNCYDEGLDMLSIGKVNPDDGRLLKLSSQAVAFQRSRGTVWVAVDSTFSAEQIRAMQTDAQDLDLLGLKPRHDFE